MNLETIELLKELKADRNALLNHFDKFDLIRLLFENIGISDSEIRDDLIYPVLSNMIFYNDFDAKQIDEIIEILLSDKNLFFDLEKKYENSVLTRSFSILQLVIVVYRHRQQKWLSEKQLMSIYQKFMEYFVLETDYRGYIDGVGWAHSVAHSADLFLQLFGCDEFTEKEISEMLDVIQARFTEYNEVYICHEDDRMVRAIMIGLKRNILLKEAIIEWLERFAQYEKRNQYPQDYYCKANIKNLLRALYFAMVDDVDMQELSVVVKDVLKKIML